jgi:hypothetical protein
LLLHPHHFAVAMFQHLARIAETIVGFVLGRLSSMLAEIAFVSWKFQENQAFQVLGSLMLNASEDTFSDPWLGRSPQQNSIT